jgi:hypothetical protein
MLKSRGWWILALIVFALAGVAALRGGDLGMSLGPFVGKVTAPECRGITIEGGRFEDNGRDGLHGMHDCDKLQDITSSRNGGHGLSRAGQ